MTAEPIGLLLAAGAGRRFDPGGDRDKLLEPLALDGRSGLVLQHAAAHLRQALARVVVVVAAQAPRRAAVVAHHEVEVLVCPCAAEGLGSVLAWSVGRLPISPLVVALGDMPWLRPPTIRAVAAAMGDERAVAASFRGQRGHPVGFPGSWRERLLALHGPRGAGELLARFPPVLVEVADPGILADIDSAADLEPANPGTRA